MASTGNQLVATGENNAGIGATAWTSPGNIVSDNTTDATCNAAASSQYLVGRNAPLTTVPTNATINGITVRVEASEHSTGTESLNAQLQDDAGALVGSSKAATISGTTKTVYTYGGAADLWGATLTANKIHDEDFGCRFWFTTAHDVRVDYVTIAVDYTVPSPGVATETSTALALSITKIRTTGTATETETALSLTVTKIRATGDATETDSALSLSATKIYSGTSATTNAADTSSASGTVTSNEITGTSETTNAADTSAASGAEVFTGSSATTNAADTSSASGAEVFTGTSATTNAADTSSASGSVILTGTSATTNEADTPAASGTVIQPVTGTSDTTNVADTPAASGAEVFTGSSATTNAADTSAASGAEVFTGTSATTNAADTPAASGVVVQPVTGTSATTNANDVGFAIGGDAAYALSYWRRLLTSRKWAWAFRSR